ANRPSTLAVQLRANMYSTPPPATHPFRVSLFSNSAPQSDTNPQWAAKREKPAPPVPYTNTCENAKPPRPRRVAIQFISEVALIAAETTGGPKVALVLPLTQFTSPSMPNTKLPAW